MVAQEDGKQLLDDYISKENCGLVLLVMLCRILSIGMTTFDYHRYATISGDGTTAAPSDLNNMMII